MTKDEFDSMYGTGDRPPRTHTFTDAELERLIAVACREQRYALVDQFQENSVFGSTLTPGYAGIIQNAPGPTFEHVMKKYEELNIENK